MKIFLLSLSFLLPMVGQAVCVDLTGKYANGKYGFTIQQTACNNMELVTYGPIFEGKDTVFMDGIFRRINAVEAFNGYSVAFTADRSGIVAKIQDPKDGLVFKKWFLSPLGNGDIKEEIIQVDNPGYSYSKIWHKE